MLSAAVAGAIALAGCATAPTDETAAVAGQPGSPAASTATPVAPGPASATAAKTPTTNGKSPPTTTVTLPDRGRVSLAEYRAQMRDQLMKTENASADVADCAAHASWVVPRSATYDALKIPTGALAQDQATEERWESRFSSGKQSVVVSSVVTFAASAHRRSGEPQWQPVKVRCGYDNGMMLAYELLQRRDDQRASRGTRRGHVALEEEKRQEHRQGIDVVEVQQGKLDVQIDIVFQEHIFQDDNQEEAVRPCADCD